MSCRGTLLYRTGLAVLLLSHMAGAQPPANTPKTTLPGAKADVSPRSPHEITDPAVLDDLNPLFIDIARGAVRQDPLVLRTALAEMEPLREKSAAHRVAVDYAGLVVFELLDDQPGWVAQWGKLSAGARRDPAQTTILVQRLDPSLARLHDTPRAAWRKAGLSRALEELWPAPDAFAFAVLERSLAGPADDELAARALTRLVAASGKLEVTSDEPAELQTNWEAGRRKLVRLAVEELAKRQRVAELLDLLEGYLSEAGATDPQASELLATALRAVQTARARGQLVETPHPEWWEKQAHATGADREPGWDEKWRAALNAPVSQSASEAEASPLAKDPQLSVKVSGRWANATIGEILERLRVDAGVPLRLADGVDPQLSAGTLVQYDGPLWSVMRQLAESPATRGNWNRDADAYVFHVSPSMTPPPPAPPGTNWVLTVNITAGILFAILALSYWMLRKRSRRSTP